MTGRLVGSKNTNVALLGVIVFSAISIWTSTRLEKAAYDATPGIIALRSPIPKETIFVPSYSESFVLDHAQELGYKNDSWVSGCEMWNSGENYPELHKILKQYARELETHTKAIHMLHKPKANHPLSPGGGGKGVGGTYATPHSGGPFFYRFLYQNGPRSFRW